MRLFAYTCMLLSFYFVILRPVLNMLDAATQAIPRF